MNGVVATVGAISVVLVAGAHAQAAGTHANAGGDSWVRRTVHDMTLEQKVGQLFVLDVYGTSADQRDSRNQQAYGVDTPAEVVAKYHPGGIIYFGRNETAPQQIAHFSNGLQQAAVSAGAKIPVLITTDQEFGTVTRVGPPATQFPGGMALGAGSQADARNAARIAGAELKAMGIRQNNAPDADVNMNPANPVIGVRSFSSDPKLAAERTAAQVDGYQDRDGGDIASTAKHFPGHGDTDVDSHTGIPVVTHTKEQWNKLDAPPFRAAIKHNVDAIMTGHIVMPNIDPSGRPATLSEKILTGLLRDELGYRGVVTTDSLQMEGVRKHYSDAEIPVMALQAGADQLLMPQNTDVAYKAVLDAVHSGALSQARIDESVTRILALKNKHQLAANPFVDESKVSTVVGTAKHLAQAQAITDRTTTALKNDTGLLPYRSAPDSMLIVSASDSAAQELAAEAQRHGTKVTSMSIDSGLPIDQFITKVLDAARHNRQVVVLTQNATDHRTADPDHRQQKVVDALVHDNRDKVAVAAVGLPYDISEFTNAPTYLATYSHTPVAMHALAGVLYGEFGPKGKLSAAIPSASDPKVTLYPVGSGLTW